MDIRVKKTKRAIQKTFIDLLREKPIEKITVKEIAERAEINKTTFYSHYETLDALTAEMERQTVQLVCDNMRGAQQLLDEPEAFVQEMFAALQQATDYLGVVPVSAMNRFTQHLRDAILEKIKGDNIEPSQYENVGAILIFVMNGLSGLLNTDAKLAQKHINVISIAVDAPQDCISALSGKIGRLHGVSTKTAYSNVIFSGEQKTQNT